MTNINKENKVNPNDLLTHNRLDIAFKYVYLKFKNVFQNFPRNSTSIIYMQLLMDFIEKHNQGLIPKVCFFI